MVEKVSDRLDDGEISGQTKLNGKVFGHTIFNGFWMDQVEVKFMDGLDNGEIFGRTKLNGKVFGHTR